MRFNPLDIARRLVGTRSTPEAGTREIAYYAGALMELMGLSVDIREAEHLGLAQANVLGTIGPESEEDLLVNVHLDTVPPGDASLWNKCGGDPFRLAQDGDALYGLGAADAKVGLVPVLMGLRALEPAKLRARLTVVATYGEEIGLVGAKRLAEDRPPRARYAVVTEPTELEVVHAHKGLAAFEAVLSGPAGRLRTSGGTGWLTRVEGVSAHASTPHLGENALWRLFEAWPEQDPETAVYRVRGGVGQNVVPAEAEILTDGHLALDRSSSNAVPIQGLRPMAGGLFAAMMELSDGLRALPSQWGEEPIFDPPGVTHNLGVADADADRAALRFEYRLIPGVGRTEMLDALQALALDIAVKHPAVRVDVRCTRWTDSMVADPDGALARVAREELRAMGLPGTLATKAGCTEAAVYAGLGMETIVFGAGRAIGNIHKPNERTSVAALQHAAEFYRRLYRRLLM